MSDLVSHCGSDQRKRIEADYVQEREEHEEWHGDRGDKGAGPGDGSSGDGGPSKGGAHKGGFNKGGSSQGRSGNRGSGRGGSNEKGSNKGGSHKGASDRRGTKDRDSVRDKRLDERQPPPAPEDFQGESEDLNDKDEEVRSLQPREEVVRPVDSHSVQEEQPTQESENQPDQPEGTQSEDEVDQPPDPPKQPTKRTGSNTGKPTVQCCAICFTQLKSLKGLVRPLASSEHDTN